MKNRPTLNYGSILAMRCIGINDTFTMSMPLQILPPLNADFDGDKNCLAFVVIRRKKESFELLGRAKALMP